MQGWRFLMIVVLLAAVAAAFAWEPLKIRKLVAECEAAETAIVECQHSGRRLCELGERGREAISGTLDAPEKATEAQRELAYWTLECRLKAGESSDLDALASVIASTSEPARSDLFQRAWVIGADLYYSLYAALGRRAAIPLRLPGSPVAGDLERERIWCEKVHPLLAQQALKNDPNLFVHHQAIEAIRRVDCGQASDRVLRDLARLLDQPMLEMERAHAAGERSQRPMLDSSRTASFGLTQLLARQPDAKTALRWAGPFVQSAQSCGFWSLAVLKLLRLAKEASAGPSEQRGIAELLVGGLKICAPRLDSQIGSMVEQFESQRVELLSAVLGFRGECDRAGALEKALEPFLGKPANGSDLAAARGAFKAHLKACRLADASR